MSGSRVCNFQNCVEIELKIKLTKKKGRKGG